MTMPDVTAAVRSLLLANAALVSLVGQRVFGAELPRGEVSSMPRKCVVLQASAGGFGRFAETFLPAGESRLDLRCYGETPYEANRVYRAAHPVLRTMERHLRGDALLYSITPVIDASALREPKTRWPMVFASYNVFAAEVAATS